MQYLLYFVAVFGQAGIAGLSILMAFVPTLMLTLWFAGTIGNKDDPAVE